MKKELREKLLKKVEVLKKQRQKACVYGDIATQQSINYEILGIAEKLKVDYYEIA